MQFYLVDTIGVVDGEMCVLDLLPEGVGLEGTRLQDGERMADAYPENAIIRMSKEEPGLKLESLLGNVQSLLIVSLEFRSLIEELCQEVDIEYLPFTLYNHKGRPHSKHYTIINPIGTCDCIDLDASEIDYFEEAGDPYDGDILDVDRFVISHGKADKLPHLFRVPEDPSEYFISQEMATQVDKRGLTNVTLEEIEVV